MLAEKLHLKLVIKTTYQHTNVDTIFLNFNKVVYNKALG